MPALAFGLKSSGISRPAPKRKAVFDDDDNASNDIEDDDGAIGSLQKSKSASSNAERPTKYTNLSALRSAKLQDEEASKLDASVYDYDAVYDTFHAIKDKKTDESSGPKYMTSLLQSAEVRKRDQMRAKEKLLQKERDAEGDEFAGIDKFVTGAYKKQLEENRKLEEEEKQRADEEEGRRRKGGGMTEFNKSLLRKEEERQQEIQKATEEARKRKQMGDSTDLAEDDEDIDENKMAAELNKHGGNIVVNDEGEVVDKRQLLNAGLNVAPKKKKSESATEARKPTQPTRIQDWRRSEKVDARASQRERQTRMIERQIEEMAEKQRQAEDAEKKEIEEKNKSKLTDEAKMGAKERYLQRKREREEQAKKG